MDSNRHASQVFDFRLRQLMAGHFSAFVLDDALDGRLSYFAPRTPSRLFLNYQPLFLPPRHLLSPHRKANTIQTQAAAL